VASVVIIIRQVILLCRDMFSSAILASVSSVALPACVRVHDQLPGCLHLCDSLDKEDRQNTSTVQALEKLVTNFMNE
jgi:hypothetical protein